MKWTGLAWCAGVALLVAVPVGLRVLTWSDDRARAEASPEDIGAGKNLFNHEWQPHDPLSAGDGLGPVFNAKSCVACHRQGGVGGGGGLEHNVTLFVVDAGDPDGRRRDGVVHAHATAPEFQETLNHVNSRLPAIAQPSLREILVPEDEHDQVGMQMGRGVRRGRVRFDLPPGVHLAQRNTPALFGAGLIDAIPDRVILANARMQRLRNGLAPSDTEHLAVGRPNRLNDGRIGRFGWKGQSATLGEFVQAACANELGLSNPGHAQPRPMGRPDYQAVGLDLTQKQCDQMTAFIGSLRQPDEQLPADPDRRASALRGKHLFRKIGCAACHTPDLGSVSGIYSDLLLHRMGKDLEAGGSSYGGERVPAKESSPSDAPLPEEWRTPPLWGVADSGPYLHDGRAATLDQAIRLHGGQGARSAQRFAKRTASEQADLIEFLRTLRAPAARPR